MPLGHYYVQVYVLLADVIETITARSSTLSNVDFPLGC